MQPARALGLAVVPGNLVLHPLGEVLGRVHFGDRASRRPWTSTAGFRVARVRLALLALAVPLAACGPPPWEVACSAAPFIVRAQHPLDCAAVQGDVAMARGALESGAAPARWRLSLQEFDELLAGVSVFVHEEPTFGRDGRSWVGRTSVDGIELGSRGDALPHELMHAVDVQRGQLLTGYHSGWDWEFDDQVTTRMSGAWSP